MGKGTSAVNKKGHYTLDPPSSNPRSQIKMKDKLTWSFAQTTPSLHHDVSISS